MLSTLGIDQVGTTGIGAVDVGLGDDGLLLGKPQLTVALAGPSGYKQTVTRTLDTILPGDTITYPFNWPDRLAVGNYTITATLTGGGTSVTRTQTVRLGKALAGTSPSQSTPTTSSSHWWRWLLVAAVVVVLLGMISAGYLRWRRGGGPGGPGATGPHKPIDTSWMGSDYKAPTGLDDSDSDNAADDSDQLPLAPVAGGSLASGPVAGGPVASGPVGVGPVAGGPVASASGGQPQPPRSRSALSSLPMPARRRALHGRRRQPDRS
jgi:hypothetical protein